MVRKSIQDEELAKLKEAQEERKRQNTLKAMGAVMKNVIQEREIKRKAQHGGYVELSGSEERAAALAKEARDEFRAKLRENKRRLAEAVARAPTLIERLEQENAKGTAASKALSTVQLAVTSELGKEGEEDDLFDEYERMKLGL